MIRQCDNEDIAHLTDMAFTKNNLPQFNCAYCPKSKEAIEADLSAMLVNGSGLILCDDEAMGFMGFAINAENGWVDCVGPFFMDNWQMNSAKALFDKAREMLPYAVRFNFYFDSNNADCAQLMALLGAEQSDNEYILALSRGDYTPKNDPGINIVPFDAIYENALVALHDTIFKDVYVTGSDIVRSLGVNRKAFCALENGAFIGYGVLKYELGGANLTAEIFGVVPEKRGKGCGFALLNAVVSDAFAHFTGDRVTLVVAKLNAPAQSLYFSCGFKLVCENMSFHINNI